MAMYQIKEPAYVRLEPNNPASEEYFFADQQNPRVITVGDDVEPSARWIALDDGARAAKKKLAEFRALPQEKKDVELEKRRQEREDAEVKEAEARLKGARRAQQEEGGGTHLANPAPADAAARGKARASDKPVI